MELTQSNSAERAFQQVSDESWGKLENRLNKGISGGIMWKT